MRFDPSEEQRNEFLERLENVFSQLKERVDKNQMKLLDNLHKKFKSAETAEELNWIREQLLENFRILAPGRDFFGDPLQGPDPGTGTYRLILTANEKSYTRYLVIRKDPLLKK
ncbi:MAG: hypothetical protein WBF32_04210 [Candidatus Aminicenantaceae bacterium]